MRVIDIYLYKPNGEIKDYLDVKEQPKFRNDTYIFFTNNKGEEIATNLPFVVVSRQR